MTLTGCRIRFDCPVGPAGVVIEIPCSGAKFFLFYGLHRSVLSAVQASRGTGSRGEIETLGRLFHRGTLNTAAPLRPAGTG